MPDSVAIVGATSLIAEHCARLWAMRGCRRMVLVARDAARVQPIADDLRVRIPTMAVEVVAAPVSTAAEIGSCIARVFEGGAIDVALIAHGVLPDQLQCERDLGLGEQVLQVNAVSPVLCAEAFVSRFLERGSGTVVVIGSVAGDRGRRSNYVYGAAKALVAAYVEGLQHRLAGTGVRAVLVKPGPTDTPMTAHLKAAGARLAPAEAVATRIVAAAESGRPVVYAPAIWRVIMLVIRHLPRVVFNRLRI